MCACAELAHVSHSQPLELPAAGWALRLARDWAPCSARDDMHVGDCWRIVGEDWHVGCSVRPQEALDLSEGIHGGSVVTGQGGTAMRCRL